MGLVTRFPGLLICLVLFLPVTAQAGDVLAKLVRLEKPRIPDAIDLPDRFDQRHNIDNFNDRITVVHFWATWCVPCREELPALEDFQRQHEKNNLRVITVAADNPETVKEYLAKRPLSLMVLIDQYGAAIHGYKVKALPASYIMGSNGKIQSIIHGKLDWSSYSLEELLTEKPGL